MKFDKYGNLLTKTPWEKRIASKSNHNDSQPDLFKNINDPVYKLFKTMKDQKWDEMNE